MNRLLLIVLVLSLINSMPTIAQKQTQSITVSGFLQDDSDKSPLIGATVQMINVKDSARSKYAVADVEGKFQINELEKAFYKSMLS